MELRQRLELRKLLAPELRQSLKILTLPLLDLKNLVDEEMLNNPILEELPPPDPGQTASKKEENLEKLLESLPPAEDDYKNRLSDSGKEDKSSFSQSLITKKATLQDMLLRQLGMFCENDEELFVGQEIIGNIDTNGYLKADLAEIARAKVVPLEKVEKALALIQQFEPAGVGARDIAECLLIQLRLANALEPVIEQVIRSHLEDVARKNFTKIAKELNQSLEKIELAVRKISLLNPKPGRNYSAEDIHQVLPDVFIEDVDGELRISINNEDIPHMMINKSYREMLKKKGLDAQTKEFIAAKLARAYELLRAVAKRQTTLRKVMETIVAIQQEAIRQDVSYMKPLTFAEVAQKIEMHETTVCRVVMNKYAQTPAGIIALKDFFPSKIRSQDPNGESVSSKTVKSLIRDTITEEDKKHPLSDEDIVKLLKSQHSLNVARRTVAKYREELKILSSVYRREK